MSTSNMKAYEGWHINFRRVLFSLLFFLANMALKIYLKGHSANNKSMCMSFQLPYFLVILPVLPS